MSLKCALISHFALEKDASGLPYADDEGFGVPALMSEGILERGKNHVFIPVVVSSVAYTPPPWAFKPLPNVWGTLAEGVWAMT